MSIIIIIIPYYIRIQTDFLIFESDLQEQAFFRGKEPITNSRISKKKSSDQLPEQKELKVWENTAFDLPKNTNCFEYLQCKA